MSVERIQLNGEKSEQGNEDKNLVAFFDLLLKVDRRVNPNLYKAVELCCSTETTTDKPQL